MAMILTIHCKPNVSFTQIKSCLIWSYGCRALHSKCLIGHRNAGQLLAKQVVPIQVCAKRHIDYRRIRTFYRTIRLKDRGIEHNFAKDGIDPAVNIIAYKSEINRMTTLGGIVFPFISILVCLIVLVWPQESPISPDPYHNPSFLERHWLELIILMSILHMNCSKRYVLRMYFNRKTNMFSVSTWKWYIPFKTHTIECSAGSAVESKPFGQRLPLLTTMLGNCKIGRKRFFVNEEHFTFPVFANVLYGYSDLSVLKQFVDTQQDFGEMDKMIKMKYNKLYD